ncbi:NUDIX domain-containing protein [Nocardiopsis sp. YSL2]|uniref:NUDIX hydrolase n=1 Tax=Nocardiopsis sp. YSL2 TaxID=2939492 RepID=UPI0026F45726|nr:NUDIX domain-containing protein [Nocardiopsis sp. YSL2]
MHTTQPRGAVALITNSRGEYLLHLRDDIDGVVWPGHWSLLGGGCEPGETPRQAVVRELQEEAELVLPELTELCEAPDTLGSGLLVTFFTGTWDGDAGALPLHEGQKLDWFAPRLLDSLPIPPFARRVLNDHRAAGI